MRVERIQLRDFRNYEAAEVELAAGLTVVAGANGAGKTNLLEAVYFGCTARSPRSSNERELVASRRRRRRPRGAGPRRRRRRAPDRGRLPAGRAEAPARGRQPGRQPGDRRGAPARERVPPGAARARKGCAGRAPRPSRPGGGCALAGRAETRRSYSRALAQRNALVARIRAGSAGAAALDTWDAELARHGIRLHGGPRGGRGRPAAAVRRPRRPPRPVRRRRAALPAALGGERRRRPGRRARGAPGRGPRPRLHRARPAPRRASDAARQPAPARIRLAGPAARRAPRAAVRRARRCWPSAWAGRR